MRMNSLIITFVIVSASILFFVGINIFILLDTSLEKNKNENKIKLI